MAWRFIEPNKPIRASTQFLDSINERHVVDVKLDGWRTEVSKFDGKIHAMTRRNTIQNVPDALLEEAGAMMPDNCALDCEWLNPSRIKSINTTFGTNLPLISKLVVFDITWWNGKYNGAMTLKDRRSLPFYTALPILQLSEIVDSAKNIIAMPTYNGSDPKSFYQESERHIISEGVVIKRLTSTTKGKWYKVKYRK